jgi:hypothetical protein
MATAKVKMTGGSKLGGWINKVKNSVGAPVVRVGWLEGATYPDGTPVSLVASFQEFGTPNARWPIPPRPTLRPMIEAGKTRWPAQLAKALVARNYNGRAALEDMGHLMVGQLQNRVIRANTPPLSPVTIMMRSLRRKYPQSRPGVLMVYRAIRMVQAKQPLPMPVQSSPLTDTKMMLQSISFEVTSRFGI